MSFNVRVAGKSTRVVVFILEIARWMLILMASVGRIAMPLRTPSRAIFANGGKIRLSAVRRISQKRRRDGKRNPFKVAAADEAAPGIRARLSSVLAQCASRD
jgi:hypothetical protein